MSQDPFPYPPQMRNGGSRRFICPHPQITPLILPGCWTPNTCNLLSAPPNGFLSTPLTGGMPGPALIGLNAPFTKTIRWQGWYHHWQWGDYLFPWVCGMWRNNTLSDSIPGKSLGQRMRLPPSSSPPMPPQQTRRSQPPGGQSLPKAPLQVCCQWTPEGHLSSKTSCKKAAYCQHTLLS